MGFQEFLLAVLERTLSRATGLIYLGIGAAISVVEYLNANPKPDYFLTNSIGNLLIYVGLVTVVVRTVQLRLKNYDNHQARWSEWEKHRSDLATVAVSNLPLIKPNLKSALKAQMRSGKDRFYVTTQSNLMIELRDCGIIIRPHDLGEPRTNYIYMIHPAVWEKRDEIINDASIRDRYSDEWYEAGRI